MRLTLEQINKNRAEAGLRPMVKKVVKKWVSVKVLEARRERKRELLAQRKESASLLNNIKSNISSLRKNTKARDFLVRKKVCSEKLLEYLSNPDNSAIKYRKQYLRITNSNSYTGFMRMFPDNELSELEGAALIRRRNNYARKLVAVDDGLFKKATKGGAAEAKLVYQRFEGWSEKVTDNGDARPLVIIQVRNQSIPNVEIIDVPSITVQRAITNDAG